MKNKIILAAFALLASTQLEAQVTRYVVKLRNKGDNTFSLANPAAYLSQRAIARRQRYGIAVDSTDLPLTQRYLDSIASVPNVTILNRSRWLNEVSIQTSDGAALSRIQGFPFVVSVGQISFRVRGGSAPAHDKFAEPAGTASTMRVEQTAADVLSYGQSANQVKIHKGNFLHNIGLRGEGMIIGMLDAGYQNYLTLSSLDSVRAAGQILGTWDFVANNTSVNEDNNHGMHCFSTIAANIPGTFVGTANKAQYYLFRTEDAGSETPIEEFNWVCGAERIDSSGGDLISSSLGYYDFDAPFTSQNHPFSHLDGNTTRPAIGADLAAKKGILVVNAAGNEGTNAWRKIITPADGDSVLAVGAVNGSGVAASFTSQGPSADGQIKPDVASVGVGTIIQYSSGPIAGGNGTSYATPNLAGLVTCLWQGFPEFNNMTIVNAIRASGTKAVSPDTIVGYGIPDMRQALISLTQQVATVSGSRAECVVQLNWSSKDVGSMRYRISRFNNTNISFISLPETVGSGSVFGAMHSYQLNDTLRGIADGTSLTYTITQVFDTAAASFKAATIGTVNITVNTATCAGTATPNINISEQALVVVPNPARGDAALQIELVRASNKAQIVLTDAAGKRVWNRQLALPAGRSRQPLPLGQIASGKYYVSLYVDGELFGTRELVKL